MTERLESFIQQQTHGRVHRITIEIDGNQVILHGRAGTYYAKQLAQRAALELLSPAYTLVNNIEVG